MKVIKLPRHHNDTTRCYPRTMREAFPNDASYAEYIESPHEKISRSDTITLTISLILWTWLISLFAE